MAQRKPRDGTMASTASVKWAEADSFLCIWETV